ncbi:MAG TPA: NIPSNAP family protein [Vicinamibacterales bacterium]|nr:NIPSNAP family protein [Vicinamibacterales bacterium]
MKSPFVVGLLVLTAFAAGAITQATLAAQPTARVFELRTYTAPDGKLGELHARFRDHTLRIFEKHGMTSVIYLAPMDAPAAQNQLVYLLAHQDREAAKASWEAFRNDPEWKKVAAESQANGPLTSKVESMFLTATDYSPLK